MLNQCNFIGRLGQDPEIRYTANGDPVASFSIACSEKWKDKQGNPQERTEWVNCAVFGKLANIVGEYLSKGSLVYISGKMQTEKYQDRQTQQDRYSTKINVREMKMLGGGENRNEQTQHTSGNRAQANPPQQEQSNPQGGDFDNSFDDDIPF